MTVIEQSVREVLDLQGRIAATPDDDHEASVAALEALADHPCAWHLVDRAAVLEAIAEHQRAAGLAESAEVTDALRGEEPAALDAERTCPTCHLTAGEADARIEAGTRAAAMSRAAGASGASGASPAGASPAGASRASISMAWFPRDEWAAATALWPDLLEHLPADHDEYNRRLEGRMKRMRRMRPGVPDAVSPLSVAGLEAWAGANGREANSPEARAGLAGEVSRTGRSVPWPPGRNDPCWCQSGLKYKRCCGPVPIETDAEPAPVADA